MKAAHRLLAAAAAFAAASGVASAALAQSGATATASASVNIGTVIAVEHQSDLNFGHIVITVPASPASVTVGTSDAVTGITNASEVTGGSVKSAGFGVSGVGGSAYTVTLPQTAVSLGSGGNPPTVDTFSTNLASNVGQLSGDSSGIGLQSFNVGAVLHVPANTQAGSYTGNFQVGVAYN